MSRDAIPVDRLTKSLPFSSQPATAASSTASCKDTTSLTEMHAIELVGTCTVGSSITPIRLHLRGYFSKLLQKKRERPTRREDKSKTKPHFYGEALTLDEVTEMYAEEEALKAKQKAKKKGMDFYRPYYFYGQHKGFTTIFNQFCSIASTKVAKRKVATKKPQKQGTKAVKNSEQGICFLHKSQTFLSIIY